MVTRRSDGTFSVSAKQTSSELPAKRIPHRHRIDRGQDVLDALSDIVGEAGYAIWYEVINDIRAKVSRLDKRIDREIKAETE